MTIPELPLSVTVLHEQRALREALCDRRHGLFAALRLYDSAAIADPAHTPLAQRTRAPIVDLDAALAILHTAGYGTRERCRRPIALQALTYRPLEMLCSHDEPFDAA